MEMLDVTSMEVADSVSSNLRILGHYFFADIKSKRLEVRACG
jgi:hypothetical protein